MVDCLLDGQMEVVCNDGWHGYMYGRIIGLSNYWVDGRPIAGISALGRREYSKRPGRSCLPTIMV